MQIIKDLLSLASQKEYRWYYLKNNKSYFFLFQFGGIRATPACLPSLPVQRLSGWNRCYNLAQGLCYHWLLQRSMQASYS